MLMNDNNPDFARMLNLAARLWEQPRGRAIVI